MSEETALLKLADYCARGEHCAKELLDRLARWHVEENARMRIMTELQKRGYFDDERYARAFVHDKVHFDRWGRHKVEQALWSKGITEDIRRQVLSEVAPESYINALAPLLKQKRRSIKYTSNYELSQKLVKFAMGRGYTMDIIRHCIDVEDEDQFLD